MQKQSKIILGIDPGTLMMGYGLILCNGQQIRLVAMGVLNLSGRKDPYERLQLIHKKVTELIKEFHPTEFAIEAPFFGKNVQSMLKLGRAQGVAIATAMHAGLPVTEYSPKKVKQSVTGNGNSGKEQVWKMLQTILKLEENIKEYDASDALAVAVCHHLQFRALPGIARSAVKGGTTAISNASSTGNNNIPGRSSQPTSRSGRKKPGEWEAFVRQNPGKIRTR